MSEDKNINRIADYIEGKILQGLEETPKVSVLIIGESEAEGTFLLDGGDLDIKGRFIPTPYSSKLDPTKKVDFLKDL